MGGGVEIVFCPDGTATGGVVKIELHVIGAIRYNSARIGQNTVLEVDGVIGSSMSYFLIR